MSQSVTNLRKAIMRRVYYVYALRLSFHPMTLSLAVFAIALYLLAKLVFVSRVVESFLNVPVREVVPHTLEVLGYADALTLIVFGVCIMAVLSIGVNLTLPRFHNTPRMQTA